MKTAGIREFKSKLSAYLREVQAGETVVITDRGRAVAVLKPPERAEENERDRRLREMADRGLVRLPTASPEERARLWKDARSALPTLPPGTAQRLLELDREDK